MRTTCKSCGGTGKGKTRANNPNFHMTSGEQQQYIERHGYEGFERISTIDVECNCKTCGGSGQAEYKEIKISCELCNGSGRDYDYKPDNEGYHHTRLSTFKKCNACDGTGKVTRIEAQ